jgi:hypothetical protein
MSKEEDAWDDAKTWFDKYDHPLWAKYSNDAQGAGHGGMDFFVVNAFIESIKRKSQLRWMYMMRQPGAPLHR